MPGRNSPCHCGSGKKFKLCHGAPRNSKPAVPDPARLLEEATRLARSGKLNEAIRLAAQLPASAVKFQFQIDLLSNRERPGDLEKATDICKQWRKSEPRSVQPYFRLMQLYWKSGQVSQTQALAEQAAVVEPEHRLTPHYQAVSLQLNGDLQNALKYHRVALLRNSQQNWSDTELDLEAAIAAFEVSAGHYPASPRVDEDALVEAKTNCDLLENALRQWLESEPDLNSLDSGQRTRYSNACYNLACVDTKRFMGLQRALGHLRNALLIDPAHALARSNYLLISNYDPDLTDEIAVDSSRRSCAELRHQFGVPKSNWANEPKPERKLRIAYLSSDFRRHSVVHFITPVLENHNREQLRVHAYYTGRNRDEWTDRVAASVDQFTLAGTMTDQQLHQKITDDRIDILIDLNGFTNGHRIEMLMRRAAPIQVSWIGYPGSTGLDVMDYRIVDANTDPLPESAQYSSEKLLYMDPVFSVYLPDDPLPEISADTPATRNGFVTFGSFNALPKLNTRLFETWGKILTLVADSKLLIKNKMMDQPSVREGVVRAFQTLGINKRRLILLGRTPSPHEHLKTYLDVDLCLDSFPYNGTTTNCDSIIMGVPVLALAGSRHASRVTASQLSALDLDELISLTADQYVETAVRLASDMPKLLDIRNGLRERFLGSSLTDYQGFTRQLETKYREIWRIWCAQSGKII